MRTNTKPASLYTHEGAKASHISQLDQLRRSVMACMLWEGTFYEDGKEIGLRIAQLVNALCMAGKALEVQALAIEARTKMKLRHAPLHICVELARVHKLRASTLVGVIERPDELTEFLSLYWASGRVPLSKQVKLGLGWAFRKFNAYNLAKYNRDNAVKLRDVLFLTHAKPKDEEQAQVWKKLVEGTLESPDTWEVALSGGADKKATFERLMSEGKLGALAFLRNLRNMEGAGVSKQSVRDYAGKVNIERVLPFRFIAAARAVPKWEDVLEPLMLSCMGVQEKLPGKTVLLVDVSGSMADRLSGKSDLTRLDAAKGLAILLASICEDVQIATFDTTAQWVANRKGFALADAIGEPRGGTNIAYAVQFASGHYDRLILLTDEQAHDGGGLPDAGKKAYGINVATNKNGVAYGNWIHFDGFSEAVVDYIRQYEAAK